MGNDIADAFHKWWQEFSNNPEEFDEETLHQDACAEAFHAGYQAGSDDGFIEGQENMLETGYELPRGQPED